jgi:hypothetical protein
MFGFAARASLRPLWRSRCPCRSSTPSPTGWRGRGGRFRERGCWSPSGQGNGSGGWWGRRIPQRSAPGPASGRCSTCSRPPRRPPRRFWAWRTGWRSTMRPPWASSCAPFSPRSSPTPVGTCSSGPRRRSRRRSRCLPRPDGSWRPWRGRADGVRCAVFARPWGRDRPGPEFGGLRRPASWTTTRSPPGSPPSVPGRWCVCSSLRRTSSTGKPSSGVPDGSASASSGWSPRVATGNWPGSRERTGSPAVLSRGSRSGGWWRWWRRRSSGTPSWGGTPPGHRQSCIPPRRRLRPSGSWWRRWTRSVPSRSFSMESPGPARPSSTSSSSGRSWSDGERRPSFSCPKSPSPPRPCIASVPGSGMRWRSCTRGSPTGSATTSGASCARVRSGSSWAPGPPSSLPSRTWAPSWWTRNTTVLQAVGVAALPRT